MVVVTRSVAVTIHPDFDMDEDKCQIVKDAFNKRGWQWIWVNEKNANGGSHSHAGVILPEAKRTASGEVGQVIKRLFTFKNPRIAVRCKTWFKKGWSDVYMQKENKPEYSVNFPHLNTEACLADDIPDGERRSMNLFARYELLTKHKDEMDYGWHPEISTFRDLAVIYNTLCWKDRLIMIPSDPRRQKHELHMWMKYLMKYTGGELGDPNICTVDKDKYKGDTELDDLLRNGKI